MSMRAVLWDFFQAETDFTPPCLYIQIFFAIYAWACCVSYTLPFHPLFLTRRAGSAVPCASDSSRAASDGTRWRVAGERAPEEHRAAKGRRGNTPKKIVLSTFPCKLLSQLLWRLLHFSKENRKRLGLDAEPCRARDTDQGTSLHLPGSTATTRAGSRVPSCKLPLKRGSTDGFCNTFYCSFWSLQRSQDTQII